MITYFVKRSVKDILEHRFLNFVTIITVAMSSLIVSAFILFFVNINNMINSWENNIKIMAYLHMDTDNDKIKHAISEIRKHKSVKNIVFIPKNEALKRLKEQMKGQASLFEDLKENPLPDTFEIHLKRMPNTISRLEKIASFISYFPVVEEVEYGQKWLGRFTNIFQLLKISGYALGCLFITAAVFIVANTIRLLLYARQEEIEIMRLVGAPSRFISMPLYFEGVFQGAIGGIIGLIFLFFAFLYVSSKVEENFALAFFSIQFLSPFIMAKIIFSSIFVGWIGSYFSIKQFLKA